MGTALGASAAWRWWEHSGVQLRLGILRLLRGNGWRIRFDLPQSLHDRSGPHHPGLVALRLLTDNRLLRSPWADHARAPGRPGARSPAREHDTRQKRVGARTGAGVTDTPARALPAAHAPQGQRREFLPGRRASRSFSFLPARALPRSPGRVALRPARVRESVRASPEYGAGLARPAAAGGTRDLEVAARFRCL